MTEEKVTNEINELQKIVDGCLAKREKIQLAREKVDKRMPELKYELKRLEKEYPRVLAMAALNEPQGDDPKECRRLIQNIKQDIADTPLIQKELTARDEVLKEKARTAGSEISKKESRIEYDKLKAELRKAYSEPKLNELRRLSNMISHYGDVQKDFEQFVIELQQTYKRERIIR